MTADRLFPSDPLSRVGTPWSPWEPEVFVEARSRNAPILLLLVDAWSGPCLAAVDALMADDGFNAWLREQFVAIAVDVDERPDIAARYLLGPAPAAVFLTPDGEPLVRPERAESASVRETGAALLQSWSARRDELLHEVETERHMRAAERHTGQARRSPGVLTPAILDVALEVLEAIDQESLDATQAAEAIRIWRYARLRRGIPRALDLAREATRTLIENGRFEGELGAVRHTRGDNALAALDQATALLAFTELAAVDDEWFEQLREPVGGIVRFVVDVLGEPHGGTRHSARDLDPEGVEERVLTHSSARAARALLLAGATYREREWVERGRRGVDFLLEHVRAGEAGVYHRWDGAPSGFGFLVDQAEALLAILQAYEVSGRAHYIEHARRLARIAERDWREPGRGFRDLSELLESQSVEPQPGLLAEAHLPLPANIAMAEAFMWLARLTHDQRMLDIAVDALAMYRNGIDQLGPDVATYARVVDRILSAEPEIKVVAEQPPGEPDRSADPLLDAAIRLPVAGRTVQRLTLGMDDDLLIELGLPLDVPRVAYVCVGSTCSAPLAHAEQLLPAIEELTESPVG